LDCEGAGRTLLDIPQLPIPTAPSRYPENANPPPDNADSPTLLPRSADCWPDSAPRVMPHHASRPCATTTETPAGSPVRKIRKREGRPVSGDNGNSSVTLPAPEPAPLRLTFPPSLSLFPPYARPGNCPRLSSKSVHHCLRGHFPRTLSRIGKAIFQTAVSISRPPFQLSDCLTVPIGSRFVCRGWRRSGRASRIDFPGPRHLPRARDVVFKFADPIRQRDARPSRSANLNLVGEKSRLGCADGTAQLAESECEITDR